MSSRWSPSCAGLGMRGQVRPCAVYLLLASLAARVSAFADDITVFVSRRLDIKAVKEAVVEYERIAGAKVNFDKSEGLRLGAWRGSNTLQGPSAGVTDPSASSGCGSARPPTGAKLVGSTNQGECSGGNLAFKEVVLKGRAEACATYVFLWSFTDWLYFLCLRHVGWHCNNPSPDCSGEVQGRWSVGRSVSNVHATGVWVCLIWRATGLLKDLHTSAGPWQGTQCGDERRVGLFLASSQTQSWRST